jgi:hypothetical protein
MKKIITVLFSGILLFACTNRDIGFDDYLYQSIYFPFQMPVRTLILGDEVVGDNSIDKERAFTIGVVMAGVYENREDREITIAYAPELAENIINAANGDTLRLLPEAYYDASFLDGATDIITIPSGELSGKTRVQLNDAFFEDPLTTRFTYVIPLRIIDAGSDTILSGIPGPGAEDPDPRDPNDWNIVPKDYTLFGIRYINITHGYYLYRGQSVNLTTDDTLTYSERFLTDNALTMLSTESLTKNIMGHVGGRSTDITFRMQLEFNHENQSLAISQVDSTTASVNGTGVYYTKNDSEAESYNGNKHRTIYLEYTYNDGTDNYQVNDSLVFVDTDVTFQEYTVTVYED